MKKVKLQIILFVLLLPFLSNCGGAVRDALEGNKRSEQSH